MYPSINIGPVVLPTAGVVVLLTVWLGLTAVEWAARRLQLAVPALPNLATVALLAGWLGARLTFVAWHWSAYENDLLAMIWPLTSGYSLVGGLLLALLALFFYGRAVRLSLASTLDALAPALLIGLMGYSLADWVAGPGYGALTAVPWGISQYGMRRHAVQLYELWGGLLALWAWWHWYGRRLYAGQLFLVSSSVYSAAYLFFNAFRDNVALTSQGYRWGQLLAYAGLLISLGLLAYFSGKSAEKQPIDEAMWQAESD